MNINSPITERQWQEWRELCELEPRLADLLEEARTIVDDKSKPAFCGQAHWYGYGSRQGTGFKPRVSQLVGEKAGYQKPPEDTLGISELTPPGLPGNRFERGTLRASDLDGIAREALPLLPNFPERLRTSRAYDIACKIIYQAIPNCRNCAC